MSSSMLLDAAPLGAAMASDTEASGEAPIAEMRIAGDIARISRIREGERYAALQQQIDKLISIHAEGPVDWAAVKCLASALLQEEGPDISAAVWLIAAAFEVDGAAGLSQYMPHLRHTVVDAWTVANPPVARMAGRRNLMLWLIERLSDALSETALPDMAPLLPNAHTSLLAEWNALAKFWSLVDVTPPPFYRLTSRFAALPRAPELSDDAGGNSPALGEGGIASATHPDVGGPADSTDAVTTACTDASARIDDCMPHVDAAKHLARDTVRERASALAKAGQLGAALKLLEGHAVVEASPRQRFHLRLMQCELIQSTDESGDISLLLAPLLRQMDEHRLDIWEPDLASRALALAAAPQVCDKVGDCRVLLGRLAAIDVAAAWRVSGVR